MEPAASIDDLLRELDWERSGWSRMANYKPLLEAAVIQKLAIYPGDPSRDVIRKVALPMGYVDVKVCAVDETWSGLKLVIRKSER